MGSETKGQDYRFENLSTACQDHGRHIEDVRWRSSVMDGCDHVFLGELDWILPIVHSLILCLCSFLSCFVCALACVYAHFFLVLCLFACVCSFVLCRIVRLLALFSAALSCTCVTFPASLASLPLRLDRLAPF